MTVSQLNIISSYIRELLKMINDLKRGRIDKDSVFRLIDDFENYVDNLFSQLAPERITDERFSVASKAFRNVTKKFRELRERILNSRYSLAKITVLDIHECIRNTYKLLTLIKSGAPTTVVFQMTPQFLREIEVSPPETLLFSNPMAAQIYNILLRREGEASIDELALELKIDDRTRDEFNKAVSHLIASGYVQLFYTPDNRIVLKLVRRR